MSTRTSRARDRESGFALILALMALVLLTSLGLTLATTTSTELQIATNYRWSQQAYYNAEAGIEVGKRYLRDMGTLSYGSSADDWGGLLWPSRGTALGSPPDKSEFPGRTGAEGEVTRNWEMDECDDDPDYGNQVGFGIVLDDSKAAYPFQNSSEALGQTLNGTFTLWIRRPIDLDESAGTRAESADDSKLVLTAEGTAPFKQGSATSTYAMTSRAVRYLEVTLSRTSSSDCENRAPQAGGGPSGANFDQCDALQQNIASSWAETAAGAAVK